MNQEPLIPSSLNEDVALGQSPDIAALIQDLSFVSENLQDETNKALIVKTINFLKKSQTVQVGDKKITFIANDAVKFTTYDD
ncbi:hypothetical protein HPT25_23050 [Bacillus sp. BRMEA1]|uniref:hypothetical protein n=1 Tax=Neobacillus endophyticus TaxID=2738405 RepID=UPI001563FD36|nr:hypothetical protein [Neobacillus endophyticus]NRD80212.1 hypothetical protein [Neobacillus endophyticus]